MAATPDLEVIKDIPGYKVILKAVLKSQIQQLVEQLASTTDEESVILTASVSDGTLSHLGSDSGKFFLDDHEDIKSQFLGFCLKRHHKKKQEKERQEALRNMPTTPTRYVGPGGPRPAMIRSPRFSSPRQPHPVALTRAPMGTGIRSPGMRHSPYPMTRPPRRTSLNFEQQSPQNSSPNATPMKLPLGNNQVIKIEPDDEDSNHSAGDSSAPVQSDNINTGAPNTSSQTSSSPSQTLESTSVVKSEAPGTEGDGTDIPNTVANDGVPPEGLSLDSDLSNLIASETSQDSGNNSQPRTPQSSASASEASNTEIDPNVNVKVESISESEMELEITGVEPGRPMNQGGSQDNWGSGQMGYDPTGATGSQADMQAGDPGYNYGDSSHMVREYAMDNHELNGIDASAMYGYDKSSVCVISNRLYEEPIYTVDEMLDKKERRGKPTPAQLYFRNLLRVAAMRAGIWQHAPTLGEMSMKEKMAFYEAFAVVPELLQRKKELWKRLGESLQNRRKYLADTANGKRLRKSKDTF